MVLFQVATPLVPPFMGGTSNDICRYYCSSFKCNLVTATSPFKSLGPISFPHIKRRPTPLVETTFLLSIGEDYAIETIETGDPLRPTVVTSKFVRTDTLSSPFYGSRTIQNDQTLSVSTSPLPVTESDTFNLTRDGSSIEAFGYLTLTNLNAHKFSKTIVLPNWFADQRIYCAVSRGNEIDFMKSVAKIIGATFMEEKSRYIFMFDPSVIRLRFSKSISFLETTAETVQGIKNRIRIIYVNQADDSHIVDGLSSRDYLQLYNLDHRDPAYKEGLKLINSMILRLKDEGNASFLDLFENQIPSSPTISVEVSYNLAISIYITLKDGSKIQI